MRALLTTLLVVCGLAGCKQTMEPYGYADTGETWDATDVLALGISPGDPVLGVGDDLDLEARAYRADESWIDVSDEVVWESSDSRVVEVDDGHLVALAEGEADVTVVDDADHLALIHVIVKGADVTVVDVDVHPSAVELHPGDSLSVTAEATFSDGTHGNIGGSCAWESDSRDVASVDATGTIVARGEGSTEITCDCGSQSATVDVSVVAEEVDLGAPDLRVIWFDVYVSGDEVSYVIDVENTGDAAASGFYVDVYLDSYGEPDGSEYGDLSEWVSSLGAGETTEIELTLTGVEPGSYDSWVLVDGDEWSGDEDPSDNTDGPLSVYIEEEAMGPDLEVTWFDAVSDGYYTIYEVEITNYGDEPAEDFWLDLWHDTYTDPSVGDTGDDYEYVTFLDAGDYTVLEIAVEDGPYSYWDSVAFVDSADNVVEYDEWNNLAYTTVYPD